MKLPIDNFELLGVGVGTDSSGVLRSLQKRVENVSLTGFNEETLEKRRKVLKRASKTLIDNQLRKEYEEKLKEQVNDQPMGVELDEQELIAGLMLLLEAGHYDECMEIGRGYEERKGYLNDGGINGREMELIMDYAALKASQENKNKRFYQRAAEILETRLGEKERIKGVGKLTKEIESEINRLLPFRILDLLSREEGRLKRDLGIGLLESLIERRGGLEKASNVIMGEDEFKSFFRQIRGYLTVQEQIEIFQRMGTKGSQVGYFIAGIALTASGFTQRKPERLKEAIGLLERIGRDELEPIISNIYLLLGDIDLANKKFSDFAEDDLKSWCKDMASDSLGQRCAWCQEWLGRDVLEGFKDIDSKADIDAYFEDKDVIEYIESQDRQKKARKFVADEVKNNANTGRDRQLSINKSQYCNGDKGDDFGRWLYRVRDKETSSDRDFFGKRIVVLLIISVLTAALTLFALLNKQSKDAEEGRKGGESLEVETKRGIQKGSEEAGLRSRIEQWHMIKRNRLLGSKIPEETKDYISQRRLAELEKEARQLQRLGKKVSIQVEVKNIKLIDRGKKRTVVQTDLIYGERVLDRNGKVLEEMPRRNYRRTYILTKKGESWMLE